VQFARTVATTMILPVESDISIFTKRIKKSFDRYA
jgi:hypothetical protein